MIDNQQDAYALFKKMQLLIGRTHVFVLLHSFFITTSNFASKAEPKLNVLIIFVVSA